MFLLPYSRESYNVPVDARRTSERLEALVSRRRLFKGDVRAAKFEIVPAITYRNSFLPIISGVIAPAPIGARVTVSMQPSPLVLAFGAVWAMAMFLQRPGAAWGTGPLSIVWFRISTIGIFYAIAMGGFWWEARPARRIIRDCLTAPTDPNGDSTTEQTRPKP